MRRRAMLVVLCCAVAPTAGEASAATCAEHGNQAEAQRAADTRDADGDGIYCESLPCPCWRPGDGGRSRPERTAPRTVRGHWREYHNPPGCVRPAGVQPITFSATRYPTVRRHTERAIARGWPAVLILNRLGAEQRRFRLLRGDSTRPGFDRDEYPPAVGRGRGKGLVRGAGAPRGWLADVAYIPSGENRSHGTRLGTELRRFCNGTRFRYVFF